MVEFSEEWQVSSRRVNPVFLGEIYVAGIDGLNTWRLLTLWRNKFTIVNLDALHYPWGRYCFCLWVKGEMQSLSFLSAYVLIDLSVLSALSSLAVCVAVDHRLCPETVTIPISGVTKNTSQDVIKYNKSKSVILLEDADIDSQSHPKALWTPMEVEKETVSDYSGTLSVAPGINETRSAGQWYRLKSIKHP